MGRGGRARGGRTRLGRGPKEGGEREWGSIVLLLPSPPRALRLHGARRPEHARVALASLVALGARRNQHPSGGSDCARGEGRTLRPPPPDHQRGGWCPLSPRAPGLSPGRSRARRARPRSRNNRPGATLTRAHDTPSHQSARGAQRERSSLAVWGGSLPQGPQKTNVGPRATQGKTHHRLLLLSGDRDGRAARGTRRQVRHGAAGAARERLLHGVCVVGCVLCGELSLSLLCICAWLLQHTSLVVCGGVVVTLCVWGNGRRVRVLLCRKGQKRF